MLTRSQLTVIIDCAGRAGKLELAEEVLREMEARGCANEVTYAVLLDAYAKCNRPAEIGALWRRLRARGQKLNVVGYTSVLHGLFGERRPDDALQALADMQAGGELPNQLTLTTLVRGLAICGRPEEAVAALDAFPNVRPNVVTYTALAHALLRNQHDALAESVMERAAAEGVQPTATTYASLIRVYCERKLLDKALAMLERAMASQVAKSPAIFHPLLAFAPADLALQLAQRMADAGVELDAATYLTLIERLANAGRRADAEEWFAKLRRSGLSLSPLMHVQLARSLSAK